MVELFYATVWDDINSGGKTMHYEAKWYQHVSFVFVGHMVNSSFVVNVGVGVDTGFKINRRQAIVYLWWPSFPIQNVAEPEIVIYPIRN